MSLTQVTTGGVDENINIDSNTLKVDGANNRVGIGTAAPSRILDVKNNDSEVYQLRLTGGNTTNTSGLEFTSADGSFQVAALKAVSSTLSAYTGGTERFRINSSGNVGVGTSSPQRLLDLKPSTNSSALQLTQSNANDGWRFHSDGPNGGNLHINRWASGTETTRLTILNDGNVGIGTTPSQKLHVTGQALFNNGSDFYINSASGATVLDAKSGVLRFDMNGTESMRISSGNLGIGRTNPSYKVDLYRIGSGIVSRFGKDTIFGEFHVAGNDVSFQGTRSSDSAVTGFFIRNPTNTGTSNFDHVTIKTTGSERLRVDSSGNVKIQTDNVNLQGAGTFRVNSGSTSGTLSLDGGSSNHGGEINLTGGSNGGRIQFRTGQGAGQQSEKMRLDENGRLLIGLTSNQGGYLLQLKNGDISTTKLVAASGGNAVQMLRFRVHNTNNTTQSATLGGISAETVSGWGGTLTFSTKPANGSPNESVTERLRITNDGAIQTRNGGYFNGTNNGDAPYSNAPIVLQNTANNTNATVVQFKGYNGSQSGSISTRVNVTTYATSSDYRLKENVVAIADGITRIKQLAPKRFNFIGYDDTTCDGFLAHEAQAVVPEAVVGTHNEVDGEGNAVMQSIDQSKLVPLLTAALQEAITKIETLEAKVAALEAAA